MYSFPIQNFLLHFIFAYLMFFFLHNNTYFVNIIVLLHCFLSQVFDVSQGHHGILQFSLKSSCHSSSHSITSPLILLYLSLLCIYFLYLSYCLYVSNNKDKIKHPNNKYLIYNGINQYSNEYLINIYFYL